MFRMMSLETRKFKHWFSSHYDLFSAFFLGAPQFCPPASPVFDKENTYRTVSSTLQKHKNKRGHKHSHGVSSQCIMCRNANHKPTCFHLNPCHHEPNIVSLIACISCSSPSMHANTHIRAQTHLTEHACCL
ncbi:hypothetical protein ILYODFUR_015059 [Ilyodon furcidens]|uniref:Uncharacterized protein n=1 Tax=Ilyodon furcidens TaxID=33524 RepID=A0ABV0TJ25_9TELE